MNTALPRPSRPSRPSRISVPFARNTRLLAAAVTIAIMVASILILVVAWSF